MAISLVTSEGRLRLCSSLETGAEPWCEREFFICNCHRATAVTYGSLPQDAAKRARLEAEQRALQRHDSGADREEDLPREEVIRRLRLLGQPITLFGEVRALRWSPL